MLSPPEMAGSKRFHDGDRKGRGLCPTKLNWFISCKRTSQSLECTNVHFGSCREAVGLRSEMVLKLWGYLAKLPPWRRLTFLISVLKSLVFLRTHSKRQGLMIKAVKWESDHNGEMSSLSIDMKDVTGE